MKSYPHCVKSKTTVIFTTVGIWNLTWITYEIWYGKFYRIYHQHNMGYWQNNRGAVVRLQALVWNCSVLHRVQTGSMAYPASYSMGREGSFPEIQRTRREADNVLPSSAEVKKYWSFTWTSPYVFMEWAGTILFYFNCSYKSHNNVTLHKDTCFCNHLVHNLLNMGAKNVSNRSCKRKIRHTLHWTDFPCWGWRSSRSVVPILCTTDPD